MLPSKHYSNISLSRIQPPALLLLISAAFTSILPQISHAADGFTNVGAVSDEDPGLSANGSVLVGQRYNGNYYEAFRWVEGELELNLGRISPALSGNSIAIATNANGSVIVGQSYNGTYNEAFRWTQAGGMQGLGRLNNSTTRASVANSVSADGNVVAGYSFNGSVDEAFRWTSSGMIGLGGLSNSGESNAYAVSSDGNVVVGDSKNGIGFQEAFLWSTATNSMIGLGTINNAANGHSVAYGTNADGTVVVGQSFSGSAQEAFRWTQSGGMLSLGGLNGATIGPNGYARAVSADGNVVVGDISGVSGFVAFRWTEESSMITVADWLASAGISITGFISLDTASSISADGDTITGVGSTSNNTEAYIARVTSSTSGNNSGASGIVGMNDLANSIAQSYSTHHQMEGLNSMTLNGAHHRPLMDIAISDGQSCGWASGDLGRAWRQANGTMGMAEIGACHDFNEQGIRVGLGVGSSFSNLDLANQGRSHITGQYGLGEVDWFIPNTSLLASVLASYGRYDADLRRGYAIGGTQPSRGSTDINAYSVRMRLDWIDAVKFGEISISPRIAYTLTRTEIDGFQEKGGSAPARFDDQDHTAKELRLGATAKYALSSKTTLLGHLEAVHRLDNRTPGVSGNLNILGIANMDFNLPGNRVSKNWGRIGAEIDYRISDRSLLNASTFVASQGHDADISAGISYKFLF